MKKENSKVLKAERVLEEFYAALHNTSIEQVTFAHLAQRIDCEVAAITSIFAHKDALLEAMVDFLLCKYEQAYMGEMDKITAPEQRLDMVLNVIFGIEWLDVSDPSIFYACYYATYYNPRVKARFKEMYTWFKALLVNEIESWVEAGLISENDPEQIAEFIITLNEGTTYYEGIMDNREAYIKRGKFLKTMVLNMLETIQVKLYI